MATRIPIATAAIAVALSISSTAAGAATVTFSGTSRNANFSPAADASCPAARPLRLNIQNGPGFATGTSNLGAFTFTQSHCTNGLPGPYSGGVFSFSFEQGDMLEGTYSGVLAGTPPALSNDINYVVTGGTGRFLGGTGTINGIGTLTFAPGQLPLAESALTGTLDLPAVPEPATWMSMILGLGTIGAALRRRRGMRGTPAAC